MCRVAGETLCLLLFRVLYLQGPHKGNTRCGAKREYGLPAGASPVHLSSAVRCSVSDFTCHLNTECGGAYTP